MTARVARDALLTIHLTGTQPPNQPQRGWTPPAPQPKPSGLVDNRRRWHEHPKAQAFLLEREEDDG